MSTSLSSGGLLVLFIVALACVLSHAQIFSGEISHFSRDQCLALQNVDAQGSRLVVRQCVRRLGVAQQFIFEQMDQYLYRIVNKQSELCLTVEGGSRNMGSRIIQMPCDRARPLFQQWQLTGIHVRDGSRAIMPAHMGEGTACITIQQGNVLLGTCDRNPSRWIVDAALHPNDLDQSVGLSGPVSHGPSNFCWHIRPTGDGTSTNRCRGTIRQDFVFTKVFDNRDEYTIRSDRSDRCFMATGTVDNGKRRIMQAESCAVGNSKLWTVGANGKIRNIQYGQCITFDSGTPPTPYTRLVLVPCQDAVEWNIRADLPVNTPPSLWEGPYVLRQNANSDPIVAASAANLKNGNILVWASAERDNYQRIFNTLGRTETAIFDPVRRTVTHRAVTNTNHDMFCPGTAVLTDGRVMVTGGTKASQTSIYDPDANDWEEGDRMNRPRGYHSMTVLADGSVFTLGGSWSGGVRNKAGEQFIGGQWRRRDGIHPEDDGLETDDSSGTYRADNHMWLFAAPNGMIFHAGPSKRMHWINPTNNGGRGSVINSIFRDNDEDAMNGNAVMYDIGKILTVGGGPNYDNSFASRRSFANSVILPTGHVVVVGGQIVGRTFTDDEPIMHAEMWDPETEEWTVLGRMDVPRNYHSVALLTRDGRVFASGGGLCGCSANHFDAELFTPPYLLNEDGSRITNRPSINSINQDENISPGDTLVVTMGGGHSGFTFAILRLGAVSHSVNNDNRRIPLAIRSQTGNQYRLAIPNSSNIVVPGTYYLFAMNGQGVPSEGEPISINPS